METRQKREYETPALEVVECEQEVQLLAGSMQDTATIDDYEDGGTIFWEDGAPEFFNIENE